MTTSKFTSESPRYEIADRLWTSCTRPQRPLNTSHPRIESYGSILSMDCRPTEELQNVIFSDESRFQIGPDNQWRRIKRGLWNPTCFASRTKFPQSIMVWGAIGRGFRSKLVKGSNSEGTVIARHFFVDRRCMCGKKPYTGIKQGET